VVPLNSMCSMKCEMPFCSVDSRREPVEIQTPTETERTCGMASVIMRRPLASVVISMSLTGLTDGVMLEEMRFGSGVAEAAAGPPQPFVTRSGCVALIR
jgi:hypothetical protein